jgi:YjbE family integral membrane protein
MDSFYPQIIALAQVIAIDVILAGDNAIVVGIAASRVKAQMRRKVILWGIVGAVALRILFAVVATELLAIVGLTLAGGILLLWVSWKMYREVRRGEKTAAAERSDEAIESMNFRRALTQIIFADVSMSLDNALAVAGAAKGDLFVLVIGLGVAVILMALVADAIARMLSRYPWITWIGLLIVLYVAIDMIWRGAREVALHLAAA